MSLASDMLTRIQESHAKKLNFLLTGVGSIEVGGILSKLSQLSAASLVYSRTGNGDEIQLNGWIDAGNYDKAVEIIKELAPNSSEVEA